MTEPSTNSDGDPPAESEPLDVCVFTSAHDATDSRVVNREAVTLDEAGYDVTYYTPFAGECPVEAVPYVGVPDGNMPTIPERLAWAGTVARVLYDTDYDVYHFHDVEVLPVGVLLGATRDATVIYDVHENVEDVLAHRPIFPEPIRPSLARAVSAVELGLARFVDAIVAASPDVAERFEGYDDVTVVTNYPQRRWAEETDPEEIDPDEDGPIRFIYRGLVSEERGVYTLLDAIERVPDEYDVSLVLGGRYATEEIEETVRRRKGDSERIEVVDWLPSLADVIDLYRDCDVGTMCFHPGPNRNDAVHRSNKLFQYMAAGLPIVVSDIGEWGELVEETGCGVAVDPQNPDEIAAVMAELAGDSDRRTEMGRAGHEAALERFNWPSQAEKLLDLYERLTGVTPYREAETSEEGERDDEKRTHQVTD